MPKYTITEYAERVGLSRAYIYKLEREDKIDFTIKGKKKLEKEKKIHMFDPKELDTDDS